MLRLNEKMKSREIVIFTQFFIVLLTQILFTVGVLTPFDSEGYNYCFENSGFTIWEPGFQLVCDITSSINDKFYSQLLGRLISIVPTLILLVVVSKKDLHASAYLFLVIFGLVLGGYRQLISVSILGIVFVVFDKANIKGFLLSCFAFLTHYSSVVAVVIYIILRNLKLSSVNYFLILSSLVFIPVFIKYLVSLDFFTYIYIPESWVQYLTGTYVVDDTDYYVTAKIILVIQSIFAISIVVFSRQMSVSKDDARLLIVLEAIFIAVCFSVDYIITARFGIYIRLLEMKFILMDSYDKNIKLAFIFIAFMRLTTLLYNSSLS